MKWGMRCSILSIRTPILTVLCIVMVACAGDFEQYRQAVSDFRTATQQTSIVVEDYIMTVNDYERQVEYTRLRYQRDYELNVDDILEDSFDIEDLELRRQTFQVLEKYIAALGALADDDTSEQWRTSVGQLREAAVSLSGTVSGLLESQEAPALVGSIAGPLETLVSVVGVQIIDAKRSQALDEIIQQADPAIQRIIAAVRADLEDTLVARRTGSSEALTLIALEYWQAQSSGRSEPERLQILDELETAIEGQETLNRIQAQSLHTITLLDRARVQLVNYAQSDKSPQNLDELYAAIAPAKDAAQALFELFVAFRSAP